MMHQQLTLPFPEPGAVCRPGGFVSVPANEVALAWLDSPQEWPDQRLLITGATGSGKTHLLHAWAAECGAVVWQGADIVWPMHLPSGQALAIDDAHTAPETALLHVLNAARELGCRLVMAAPAPPAAWGVTLPDLASRLLATLVVRLGEADDESLARLFARSLAARQLSIPPSLQAWLLQRLPRTPAALRDAARLLDDALLASGGRATREVAAAVAETLRTP